MVESYIFAGLFAFTAICCGVLGRLLILARRERHFLREDRAATRRSCENQVRYLEDQKNKALEGAYNRRQELEQRLTTATQRVADLEYSNRQQAQEIDRLQADLAKAKEEYEKWFAKASVLEEECTRLQNALNATEPQLLRLTECEILLAEIEQAVSKVYPKVQPGMLLQRVQWLCSDAKAHRDLLGQVKQRVKDTVEELLSSRDWVGIAMGLDAAVPPLDGPDTTPPREEFAGAGVELLASLQDGE